MADDEVGSTSSFASSVDTLVSHSVNDDAGRSAAGDDDDCEWLLYNGVGPVGPPPLSPPAAASPPPEASAGPPTPPPTPPTPPESASRTVADAVAAINEAVALAE